MKTSINWKIFFMEVAAIIAVAFILGSCSVNEKSAPGKPLYTNRADIQITVDDKTFVGMAVTKLDGPKDIQIVSNVAMDRVQITSCSRQDVFENVDSSWFGGSG